MIKTLVKIQKENFVREERYVHNIEDDSWLESGYEHNKTKTVVCTHDEFIESLKNKNECRVFREILVLEKNEDKKTFIIRKYTTSKKWKYIEPIKSLKDSSTKTYKSLTINYETLDFVYYENSLNRRKKVGNLFVRKNIINVGFLHRVASLFNLNNDDEEVLNGLNNILAILFSSIYGEDFNTELNYSLNAKIYRVFKIKSTNKIKPEDYLKYIVLRSYLTKYGIFVSDDIMFDTALNFKYNKTSNVDIVGYYMKELQIDSGVFITDVLTYYNSLNKIVVEVNPGEGDFFIEEKYSKFKSFHLSLDKLLIAYHLGLSVNDIISNERISNRIFVEVNDYSYPYSDYRNELKNIKYLTENKNFFFNFFNTLNRVKSPYFSFENPFDSISLICKYLRSIDLVFGVKLDFKDVNKCDFNKTTENVDLVFKTFNALIESTKITGVVTPSKAFINRVKRAMPKGTKISLHKFLKPEKPKYLDEDCVDGLDGFGNIIGKLKPFGKDNLFNVGFIMLLHLKDENIRLEVLDRDHIGIRQLNNTKAFLTPVEKDDKRKKPLWSAAASFSSKFNYKTDMLKYVGFKASYSKKYYDDLMKKY